MKEYTYVKGEPHEVAKRINEANKGPRDVTPIGSPAVYTSLGIAFIVQLVEVCDKRTKEEIFNNTNPDFNVKPFDLEHDE